MVLVILILRRGGGRYVDLTEKKLNVEYSDDGGVNFYEAKIVRTTPEGGSLNPDGNGVLNLVWDTKSEENGHGSLAGVQSCDIKLRLTLTEGETADESVSDSNQDEIQPSVPADAPVSADNTPADNTPADNTPTENAPVEDADNQVAAQIATESDGDSEQIVVESQSFCLDNKAPNLAGSEFYKGKGLLKITFDEPMATGQGIDISKMAFANQEPDSKSYDLAGSSLTWETGNILLETGNVLSVFLSPEAKNYFDSEDGGWLYLKETYLQVEDGSGLADSFGNLLAGLSPTEAIKINIVSEETAPEETAPTETGNGAQSGSGTVQNNETQNQESETPPVVVDEQPKIILKYGQKNSCEVVPYAQILAPGQTGQYTVNVTSIDPETSFKIYPGKLPDGVSIKLDNPSGQGNGSVNFSLSLSDSVRQGSASRIVLVDEFINPDGSSGQSFCLFKFQTE